MSRSLFVPHVLPAAASSAIAGIVNYGLFEHSFSGAGIGAIAGLVYSATHDILHAKKSENSLINHSVAILTSAILTYAVSAAAAAAGLIAMPTLVAFGALFATAIIINAITRVIFKPREPVLLDPPQNMPPVQPPQEPVNQVQAQPKQMPVPVAVQPKADPAPVPSVIPPPPAIVKAPPLPQEQPQASLPPAQPQPPAVTPPAPSSKPDATSATPAPVQSEPGANPTPQQVQSVPKAAAREMTDREHYESQIRNIAQTLLINIPITDKTANTPQQQNRRWWGWGSSNSPKKETLFPISQIGDQKLPTPITEDEFFKDPKVDFSKMEFFVPTSQENAELIRKEGFNPETEIGFQPSESGYAVYLFEKEKVARQAGKSQNVLRIKVKALTKCALNHPKSESIIRHIFIPMLSEYMAKNKDEIEKKCKEVKIDIKQQVLDDLSGAILNLFQKRLYTVRGFRGVYSSLPSNSHTLALFYPKADIESIN